MEDGLLTGAFSAAVFLDRDGTLIEHRPYLSDPDQVRLVPGAAESVARLNRSGVAAVLVTNQSGVARGFFSETRLTSVHDRLVTLLADHGAYLDGIYYCPHLPSANIAAYRLACRCRKPGPGMVERARCELGLEGLPTWVIGDSPCDLDLARAVGATAVLVRTGHGRDTEQVGPTPDLVVDTVSEAVEVILTSRSNRE